MRALPLGKNNTDYQDDLITDLTSRQHLTFIVCPTVGEYGSFCAVGPPDLLRRFARSITTFSSDLGDSIKSAMSTNSIPSTIVPRAAWLSDRMSELWPKELHGVRVDCSLFADQETVDNVFEAFRGNSQGVTFIDLKQIAGSADRTEADHGEGGLS